MKNILITSLLFFLFSSTYAQTWSLLECLDTALAHNRNLQIQRNNVTLATERQKEATSNLIPKVMLNADYKYYLDLPYQLLPLSVFGGPEGLYKEAQFGVPHNVNANAQIAVPIYNAQIYGGIQSSKIAGKLSELNYQKAEEDLYFEVSNRYFNAQLLLHQLSFIDSNLHNANRLLENSKLLHENLLAKGTDVNKVQLQRDQLLTQRELVQTKYIQVMNGLKFAMGVSLDSDIDVDKNINTHKAADYSINRSIDQELVETRQSLVSTELKTLKLSRLPSINAYGTYGTMGYGYREEPNEFFNFYPISFAVVQLNYVLFNGGVTQRKINQKKIELENSSIQTDLVDKQQELKIENAKLQRSAAQRTVETVEKQVQLAQSIYNQTLIQKQEGTANLTEVLLADSALREAQQQYLNAMIDYLKADLELKNLTGNFSKTND